MKLIVLTLLTLTLVIASCTSESSRSYKVDISLSEEKFQFQSDTSDNPLFNYDFTMTRKHLGDSTFEDGPLLCQSDSGSFCSIRFKKEKKFWYVMTPEGWQEFYNPKDSLLKLIYFKKEKYTLKPIGHSLIFNNRELKGFIKEELYVHSSHNSELYFDPEFGVVIIKGDVSLIRNDFKATN